jgi:hypothetical protein
MEADELKKMIDEAQQDKEPDEEIELWDLYSMSDLVEGLVGWGYGSGEEFYDYLTTGHGIDEKTAQLVIDTLHRVA